MPHLILDAIVTELRFSCLLPITNNLGDESLVGGNQVYSRASILGGQRTSVTKAVLPLHCMQELL